MKPLRNQILFKPLPSDEVSEFGIIVPESARAISNKGVIVEVGDGTSKRPMRLNKGDIGLRVKDWGTQIDLDGEIHFLMDESAIIALA